MDNYSKRTIGAIVKSILITGFSVTLSIVLLIGKLFQENRLSLPTVKDIVSILILACLIGVTVFVLIRIIPSILIRISRTVPISLNYASFKSTFVFSFVLNLLSWLVFFITFFPGTGFTDSLWILNSPLYSSIQHTLFYNLVYSKLFFFGEKLFGSPNGGAAIYALFQILFCAGILGYIVAWLSEKKCPLVILFGIQAFFLFSPRVANIVNVAVKDVMFGFSAIIMIPAIFDAIETKGKSLERFGSIFALSLGSVLTILIRNNGIYIMAMVAIGMMIAFRKKWKKLVVLFLLIVCLPAVVDKALMKYYVKNEKTLVESLGVPIQQIAMTVKSGGEISEEQRTVIEQIMPEDEIIARYNPTSVDTLKWGEGAKYFDKAFLQDNLGLFLKTWAEMLPANLGNYIQAYIMLTDGYWNPTVMSDSQALFFEYPYIASIQHNVTHIQLWTDEIQQKLESYYRNVQPLSIGLMVWILFFLCLYSICLGKRAMIVLYLPFMANWATLMVSTPINYCVRYNYQLLICLPFLIYLTFRNPDGASCRTVI